MMRVPRRRSAASLMLLVSIQFFFMSYAGGDPPAISIIGPGPSEFLTGNVEFMLDTTPPADEGTLYISSDNSSWEAADGSAVPDGDGLFVFTFDSTTVQNGIYHFLLNVTYDTDQHLEEYLGPWEVFNPRAPALTWLGPDIEADLSGVVELNAQPTGEWDGTLVNGVEYHIRHEEGDWSALGNSTLPPDSTPSAPYPPLFWDTFPCPDGNYTVRANITTSYGLTVEAFLGPFMIDNEHPPEIWFVSPAEGAVVTGEAGITGGCTDPDMDLDPVGVEFFYRKKGDLGYQLIGAEVPHPVSDLCDILWDTLSIRNGDYELKVEAHDLSDPPLRASATVNVSVRNPPGVRDVQIGARTDADLNITVLLDRTPLVLPLAVEYRVGAGDNWLEPVKVDIYKVMMKDSNRWFYVHVDLEPLEKGNYSFRIDLEDGYGIRGTYTEDGLFLHEPKFAPEVIVLDPEDMVLAGNVTLRARVKDDDVPLSGPVEFFWSRDNVTWNLIGNGTYVGDLVYRVVWNTLEVENRTGYMIKVSHVDSHSLEGVGYLKGLEVKNPPPPPPPPEPEKKEWYEEGDNLRNMIIAALVVGLLIGAGVGIFARMSQKRKRRKEHRKRKQEVRTFDQAGIKRRSEVKESTPPTDISLQRRQMAGEISSSDQGIPGVVTGKAPSVELTEYEVPLDQSRPEVILPDDR